ncbi:MAG: hypothetical protein VYE73_04410 [Acidobacteriota bacterium]|nr:hypothetical protein [Acidobacteriota bacterium]
MSFFTPHGIWNDAAPDPRPAWQCFGVLRRDAIDCVGPVADLVEQIALLDPDVLSGYGASVARVAAGVGTAEGERIRPRFVMTGGESLSAAMRQTIEEAFEVPAYDLYGSTEANLLAWQCAETGLYHVCDDNVVVELLCDGEPVGEGEEGEVFVTLLHSRAMPFLRYRLGDLAVRGPERCPCGAPWSTIDAIRGRTLEEVVLPDGTFLHHWWAVEPMIEQGPWILSYRLVQSTPGEITFEVVARDEPSSEEIEAVRSCGRATFGDDVDFRLVLVDELPPGPAGKHLRHQGLTP